MKTYYDDFLDLRSRQDLLTDTIPNLLEAFFEYLIEQGVIRTNLKD